MSNKWRPVPEFDVTKLSAEDFEGGNVLTQRGCEYPTSIPYFLKNFARVANCVTEDGPQRGYMDTVIWRVPWCNQPYNARVMESHLCLAYFYCTNKKWNPYYAMPAVKVRLEAMLEYLLSLQLPDGEFPEYGVKLGNLPATAFFTKFIAETIRLLKNGPEFNNDLLECVIKADKKAIMRVLNDQALIEHGKKMTNQFTNIWAGALAYVSMFPDKEMEEKILESMKKTQNDLQSEAGFFYELNQPDWGYTLHTHNSNERYAYAFAKNTPFEKLLIKSAEHYYDWLSYNCVREPDGAAFILNREIESRQKHALIHYVETELAEKVLLARAFALDEDEQAEFYAENNKKILEGLDSVKEIDVAKGGNYSPYNFLFENIPAWNPTKEQKNEQIKNLPYIKSKRFTHQRMDYRTQLVNVYIKRYGYYTAFNSGVSHSEQQRFGLGFLWNEKTGMLIQSQSNNDEAVWGFSRNGRLFEKSLGIMRVMYFLDGKRAAPCIGKNDWNAENLRIEYYEGKNFKKVYFEENSISIDNTFEGNLTEHIPLLIARDDILKVEAGKLSLIRNSVTLTVEFDAVYDADLHYSQIQIHKYQLVTFNLSNSNTVKYKVSLASSDSQQA